MWLYQFFYTAAQSIVKLAWYDRCQKDFQLKAERMFVSLSQDLAMYINEVKRDNETLKKISEFQSSIENLVSIVESCHFLFMSSRANITEHCLTWSTCKGLENIVTQRPISHGGIVLTVHCQLQQFVWTAWFYPYFHFSTVPVHSLLNYSDYVYVVLSHSISETCFSRIRACYFFFSLFFSVE